MGQPRALQHPGLEPEQDPLRKSGSPDTHRVIVVIVHPYGNSEVLSGDFAEADALECAEEEGGSGTIATVFDHNGRRVAERGSRY